MNILADFHENPPEPKSGVYIFVSEDYETVYYVGQSVNILNRYRGHTVKQFLTSKSIKCKFLFKYCPEKLLKSSELKYIQTLNPLLNTHLNVNEQNVLKQNYQEFINKSIDDASLVAKELSSEEIIAINNAKRQISYGVDALIKAIKLGETYFKLKKLVKSAPNKGEIVTNLGTYKGWRDFCKQNGICYRSAHDYIFMYEHQQEFAEMKLISKDPEDLKSGAAGHRKIASIKAVKWYLEKIDQEGEHIRGTLTACDYQKEIQGIAKKVKESKYVLREEYEKLKLELMMLRHENEQLKAKQLA